MVKTFYMVPNYYSLVCVTVQTSFLSSMEGLTALKKVLAFSFDKKVLFLCMRGHHLL